MGYFVLNKTPVLCFYCRVIVRLLFFIASIILPRQWVKLKEPLNAIKTAMLSDEKKLVRICNEVWDESRKVKDASRRPTSMYLYIAMAEIARKSAACCR